ncbi:MAG TPA: hypothetical protein VNQ55_05900 [Parapedobacter sp.]|nr:hypothetical protein [Parapedobacter sp.]
MSSGKLSKEDLFYGAVHLGNGQVERLNYHFDPNVKIGEEAYPHIAITNFFASFSDEIYSFAETCDARIEKYYHDAPFWMLCFYHPEGGLGRIDVAYKYRMDKPFWDTAVNDLSLIDPNPTLRISSLWTSPNFPDSKKNPELDVEIEYPIDRGLLRTALEKHYSAVMAWKE